MMKKILILSFSLLLFGCGSSPIYPKFPDYPKDLGYECPELELVKQDEEKLSEVLSVVTKNYGKYHECRAKVQAWIEWHKQQKTIYENIKK